LASNQFDVSSWCVLIIRATSLIGSILDLMVRRHHWSMNFLAQPIDLYVYSCWKSSLSRYALTELRLYRRSSLSLLLCVSVRFSGHLSRHQRECFNRKLQGFYNYFGIPFNSKRLRSLYNVIIEYWRLVLSSRGQSGFVDWKKYRKILANYPIKRPRILFNREEFRAMGLKTSQWMKSPLQEKWLFP
jgi:hypothetical protein